MRLTVKITPHGNLLHVLAAGRFDLVEAARNFIEIFNAVHDHQSEKVLFDGLEIFGDLSAAERFYYAEFVAATVKRSKPDSGDLTDPQFAYVLREPILDPARLGETVAVSRGLNVKAFNNVEEAAEWLGITADEFADRSTGAA